MKKITLLFLGMFLAINFAYCGGGWATSVVSITKDGGTAYNYLLNNEGWTDGNWGTNNAFGSTNFGAPTSLVLNGGSGNAWTNDVPGHDATSFIIYYRVYKNGDTPGAWTSIVLNNQALHNGNNYIFNKSNAAVDILALATAGANTYTLEVAMSKNQSWGAGSWVSMVPGGQETAYNAATAGYKATFAITASGVSDPTACTASISATTATLGWTKTNSNNVMVVRYAKDATAKSPTAGKEYALTDTVGSAGTVVYASGNATSTTTIVTANTDYDFYYYSVNTNNYSAGVKVTASRDKFVFAYGVDGQPGWTFLDLTQNGNNPNQYEVFTTLPDLTGLSCYVGWNSGGTGFATWVNTGGGHSKTVLLNTLSNARSGGVWIVMYKDSTSDNWGANVPLNTAINNFNNQQFSLISNHSIIDVRFNGTAQVELYTITGHLIHSALVSNQFTYSVKTGAYLLRVNGQTQKVLVK